MNRVKKLTSKLGQARQLVGYLGWRWVLFRVWYALQMRLGLLRRRTKPFRWADRPLASWLRPGVPADPIAYTEWRKAKSGRFFFDTVPEVPASVPWDWASVITEAQQIVQGRWTYFEHLTVEQPFPPNWHYHAITGQVWRSDQHWTQVSEFAQGDIKYIWELSRFSSAYVLARAYAATRDDQWAAAFWTLVEDWAQQNPPMLGANWRCGQEATFRVMAWCFALNMFRDAPSSTTERVAMLCHMIAAHGERIAANVRYAQSQNNNHGISEGVGLWTIGTLFPEFQGAEQWRSTGQRVIEREAGRQVFADGSYAQYSTNYARVALQDMIFALRIGELNHHPLSQSVKDAALRLANFLWKLSDPITGNVPNYGSNDSALVLPLSTSDSRDFRPAVGAALAYLTGTAPFAAGTWEEEHFWLMGTRPLCTSKAIPSLNATASGFYTLRGAEGWVFVRCGPHLARPHHADQLHVDLWWKGQNIALDAGSLGYNHPAPFNTGLKNTRYHNTVTVDDQDQMTPFSRFLWLDWSSGQKLFADSLLSDMEYWEGEQTGYQRFPDPVRHRRALLRVAEKGWVVLDRLWGTGAHQFMLHWLLASYPSERFHVDSFSGLSVATPGGEFTVLCAALQNGVVSSKTLAVQCGDEASSLGWYSPSYGVRQPALSLSLATNTNSMADEGRFLTWFGERPTHLKWTAQALEITFAAQADTVGYHLELAQTRDDHAIIGATRVLREPTGLVQVPAG